MTTGLFVGGLMDGVRRNVGRRAYYQTINTESLPVLPQGQWGVVPTDQVEVETYWPREIAGCEVWVREGMSDEEVMCLLLDRYPVSSRTR